jgi:uncharacterized protein YndB with AHSA1/START domain
MCNPAVTPDPTAEEARMTPDSIEREITIGAPPQRVWELLTSAEHLGTWFGDAGAEIDLHPGGALQLRWTEYGTVHGRVEAVEEPRRFAFRWSILGGRSDDDAFRDTTATLVEFTLHEADGGAGTTVRVLETGFASLDLDEAERTRRHGDNTNGWGQELEHLRQHAERVTA